MAGMMTKVAASRYCSSEARTTVTAFPHVYRVGAGTLSPTSVFNRPGHVVDGGPDVGEDDRPAEEPAQRAAANPDPPAGTPPLCTDHRTLRGLIKNSRTVSTPRRRSSRARLCSGSSSSTLMAATT